LFGKTSLKVIDRADQPVVVGVYKSVRVASDGDNIARVHAIDPKVSLEMMPTLDQAAHAHFGKTFIVAALRLENL
jgi:hypothetical protein